jgi:hypothetical protein
MPKENPSSGRNKGFGLSHSGAVGLVFQGHLQATAAARSVSYFKGIC